MMGKLNLALDKEPATEAGLYCRSMQRLQTQMDRFIQENPDSFAWDEAAAALPSRRSRHDVFPMASVNVNDNSDTHSKGGSLMAKGARQKRLRASLIEVTNGSGHSASASFKF